MHASQFSRVLRAAAALVAISASASAQGVNITMRAWREPVLMDTLRQNHHLEAAPGDVYQAALKAFAKLGIPTGRTDGTRGIIGSERFERVHALAGQPMSRSFDCGEGPTGPFADAFRLEIAVAVWVADDKPGTTLGVATLASARDVSGIARAQRPCSSTGLIETKLREEIVKMVRG